MDSLQIEEKIVLTIKELSENENNKLLLWAAIYQNMVAELIEIKKKEFKDYIYGQAKVYKANSKKSQELIDKLIAQYENDLNSVAGQFNSEYIYIQNETVLTQSNQKIAIANIIASKRGEIKAIESNNEVLAQKFRKKVYATTQKKLNYDVVIDECMTRLEECKKNTINSINEIFTIKNNQLSKNNGLWRKFINLFKNLFGGERHFRKYIVGQLETNFKEIDKKTISKISDVKIEFLSFATQMNKTRNAINYSFNETLNKA